jgi:glycine/D-amino acid oxidase-like deaminating enzyme
MKSSSLSKGKAVASVSVEEESRRRSSPIYFSPIHKPSTSPFFAIDARAGHDIPSSCDDVGQSMKIEIWGKMSIPRREGKSHEKAAQATSNNEDHDWRLLDDWDVDLDKLVLLPDEVRFALYSPRSNVL